MHPTITIIAEHDEGKIRPVSFELAALAQSLQKHRPAAIKALILGDGAAGMAQEFTRATGLDVIAIHIPGLVSYNACVYKKILEKLLNELNTVYICIAHTGRGLDFAPGLAARIGAACITGVERISWEDNRLHLTRSICNGKISAGVTAETEKLVITLQPGSYKPRPPEFSTPGRVEMRTMACPPQPSRSLGIRSLDSEDAGLAEARVIVSAGKGIGKKENLELIYRLAALFPKSAVGGSRLVCDLGWMETLRQVGVTGNTVSPELYIACGISGAFQHIAGMRDSGFVVAINTDPNAAIFNVADVCIIEDLATFIPAVLEAYGEGNFDP